jgi:hypothetical protein
MYMYSTDPSCPSYGTQWTATFLNTVVYNDGNPDGGMKTGQQLVSFLMLWYWNISADSWNTNDNKSPLTISTVSAKTQGIDVSTQYNISFSNVAIKVQNANSDGCYPNPTFSKLTPEGVDNSTCNLTASYPSTSFYPTSSCSQVCPANCYGWLSEEQSSSNYQTYCTNGNKCNCTTSNTTSSTTYYMYWPGATNNSMFYQIIFQLNTSNIVFSYGNNSTLSKSIKKYLMWYFEIPSSYFNNFTVVNNYSQVNLPYVLGTFTLNVYNQGIQPQSASGSCYLAPIYFAINSLEPSSVPSQTYSNSTCSDSPSYIYSSLNS